MEMGLFGWRMVANTQDSFKITNLVDMVDINGLTGESMMESGMKDRCMAMENSLGMMDVAT